MLLTKLNRGMKVWTEVGFAWTRIHIVRSKNMYLTILCVMELWYRMVYVRRRLTAVMRYSQSSGFPEGKVGFFNELVVYGSTTFFSISFC
jgi:hypothetical protein